MNNTALRISAFLVSYERIVMILLVVCIPLLAIFLFFRPVFVAVRAGGALDLSLRRAALDERRARLFRYENSQGIYARVAAEERKKLSYILPNEDDVPGLLMQLSSLAKAQGLTLQEISLGSAPSTRGGASGSAPEFLREVPLSLRVSGGDYDLLKKFLESLERNMRVLDVLSFSVSPDLESYSFVLRTYYLASP